MSIENQVPAPSSQNSRPRRSRLVRLARTVFGAALLITALPRVAAAQADPDQSPRVEFRVSSGTLIPTGVQGDAIKRGNLTAVQLAFVAHPALALTTTVGWARSRQLASAHTPKLDVFTFDIGTEVRPVRWGLGAVLTLNPFGGLGVGARRYDSRRSGVDAEHDPSAYGSVGAEVGFRRVRLRIEARDYVTGGNALNGSDASARNDVVVMVAFSISR